jgi:hypothetical protein
VRNLIESGGKKVLSILDPTPGPLLQGERRKERYLSHVTPLFDNTLSPPLLLGEGDLGGEVKTARRRKRKLIPGFSPWVSPHLWFVSNDQC